MSKLVMNKPINRITANTDAPTSVDADGAAPTRSRTDFIKLQATQLSLTNSKPCSGQSTREPKEYIAIHAIRKIVNTKVTIFAPFMVIYNYEINLPVLSTSYFCGIVN